MEKRSFYVSTIAIGVLASITCLLPSLYGHRKLVNQEGRSVDPIFTLAFSQELTLSIAINIAIAIYTFVEIIFQFCIYNGKDYILFFYSPLILLSAILLPNIVLLFAIFPNNYYQYISAAYCIREIFLLIGLFSLMKSKNIRLCTDILSITIICLISTSDILLSFEVFYVRAGLSLYILRIILSLFSCSIFLFSSVMHTRQVSQSSLKRFSTSEISSLIIIIITGIYLIYLTLITVTPCTQNPRDRSSKFMTCHTYMLLIITVLPYIIYDQDKMVELSLSPLRRELETKQIFVRSVSHEIRTPLNTVFLGLKLLYEEMKRESKGMEWLDIIVDLQKSTDSAVDILNDLLAYEKLESGILKLDKSDVSLRAFLNDTIHPFLLQSREKEIYMNTIYCPEACIQHHLAYLKIDKAKISQVIRNLLSNALKFTPRGGRVSIIVNSFPVPNKLTKLMREIDPTTFASSSGSSSGSSQSHVAVLRIQVVDSGPGISKENQKKLFKEIIQFNPGTLQAGKGSGLGLWISRGIAELHGGSVSVYSEGEGHGTTFTLELPLYALDKMKVVVENSTTIIQVAQTFHDLESPHIDIIPPSSPHTSHNSSSSPSPPSKNYTLHATASSTIHPRTTPTIRYENNSSPGSDCSRDEKVNEMLESSSPMSGVAPRMTWTSSFTISAKKEVVGGKYTIFPSLITEVDHHQDHQQLRQTTSRKMRVLIVDDAALNRKMLARLLRDRLDLVDEAEDGQRAVNMISISMSEGKPYDLVLIDYQMPIMDGPTATSEMRSVGFQGIVIGVTGSTQPQDVEAFMINGADRVLSKPLDINQLVDVLKEMKENGKCIF